MVKLLVLSHLCCVSGSGARTCRHILGRGLCGCVLSVHTGGDHVQVVLGALLHVHVRLPLFVVHDDRLARRVSVRNDNKVAFVIVTVAGGGVESVQIIRGAESR